MSDETIEKVFAVSSPARVSLTNISGRVEVLSGEEGTATVTVTKHIDTGDAEHTLVDVSQLDDGTVKAVTRFTEQSWGWLFGSRPCRVDYVVKLPRSAVLKLTGVDNAVFVDGFDGEFDFDTVSGNLKLLNLTGPLQINSVSGDVSAQNLVGDLKLSTVSGDFNARQANLSRIEAKTVSGDLDIQTAIAEGPYRFNSVSGDVNLTMPDHSRCSAQLHSMSGVIASDFAASSSRKGHGSQSVQIAGGSTPISMNSISGDLRLRSTSGKRVVVPSVDRLEILGRVERGELSPADALAQLNAA